MQLLLYLCKNSHQLHLKIYSVNNQTPLFFSNNNQLKLLCLVKTFPNLKELKDKVISFNKIKIKVKIYLEIISKIFSEIKNNNKFLSKLKLHLALIFLEINLISNKIKQIRDHYFVILQLISLGYLLKRQVSFKLKY